MLKTDKIGGGVEFKTTSMIRYWIQATTDQLARDNLWGVMAISEGPIPVGPFNLNHSTEKLLLFRAFNGARCICLFV